MRARCRLAVVDLEILDDRSLVVCNNFVVVQRPAEWIEGVGHCGLVPRVPAREWLALIEYRLGGLGTFPLNEVIQIDLWLIGLPWQPSDEHADRTLSNDIKCFFCLVQF